MLKKHIGKLSSIFKIRIIFFFICGVFSSHTFCTTVSTIVGTDTSKYAIFDFSAYDSFAFVDPTNPAPRWNTASLSAPNAVVKDPIEGSIIFSDGDKMAIRKVDPSGAVSTLLCTYPYIVQGLTVDPITGDLYGITADDYTTYSSCIFKVTKSNDSGNSNLNTYSSVSIVASIYASVGDLPSTWRFLGAGNNLTLTEDTQCKYSIDVANAPYGQLAYDPVLKKLYYVCLSSNVYQLNLNATPYTITTLTSGFNCNGGLALNKTFNALYVLDKQDNTIQKLTVPATASVAFASTTKVAGNGGGWWYDYLSSTAKTTSLLSPYQLAVDMDENIYVTDFTRVGNLSTSPMQVIAHNTDGIDDGYSTPMCGIFIDELGTIFVTLAVNAPTVNRPLENSLSLIKKIIKQSSFSVSSGITTTADKLCVPYYATLNIEGAGTLTTSVDNSTNLYGTFNVSGATAILNNANAFGSGGSDNSFVLQNSATLKAGTSLSALSGTTIPIPINYFGNVAFDTADTNVNTHTLTLSGRLTCSTPSTSLLTIKGGGTIVLTQGDTAIDVSTVKNISVVNGSTLELLPAGDASDLKCNVSISVGNSGNVIIGKNMAIQGLKA